MSGLQDSHNERARMGAIRQRIGAAIPRSPMIRPVLQSRYEVLIVPPLTRTPTIGNLRSEAAGLAEPWRCLHGVDPGSCGTLLIIDSPFKSSDLRGDE